MKKIISILLMSVMAISMVACSNDGGKIEATKTPFPEISGVDMEGNEVTNDIFKDYDATIVNFWNNGCGTCIEEMPELEEYYQEFKQENINLIGVGADSGESQEKLDFAKNVLLEKGVTYTNISPDVEGTLYQDFLDNITGYPTTFVVDSEGNIIGNSIVGNVKNQDDTLRSRIDEIIS